MNISADKALSDCIEKGLWSELEEKIPCFENVDTLCFVSHVAVSQHKHQFLKSAVSTKGFPFYQKVDYDGLCVPILHRAIHTKDLRTCDILLSAGALALCCAKRCPSTCHDTLNIFFGSTSESDFAIFDIACLLISSWKLEEASVSGDADILQSLLELFTTSTCTYRSYTDLSFHLESVELEDLHDFTFLSMEADSILARPRSSAGSFQRHSISSRRNFFNMIAEGAEKALSAIFTVGEQIRGVGGEAAIFETDLLARRTRNVAAQLTQRYLNRMLIMAIERGDFAIINVLLDFGFRLQAIPRPSKSHLSSTIPTADGINRRVEEKRANPIEWCLGGPSGARWLEVALHAKDDTPLLAAIRRNLLAGDVFSRLVKVGPHLLMLPSAGGILPVHLMAALGRFEMLSALLASNNVSLDIVEDCGLSALLIASFYGHVDCVRAILDYPSVGNEDEEVEEEEVGVEESPVMASSASASLKSISMVEALRSVNLQWHFLKDGANSVVLPIQHNDSGSGGSKYFLDASFNALHLAIITGNTELVECLLTYVKEAPEDYADWLTEAAVSTICYHDDASTIKSDSVTDEAQPLANQAYASLLCSPAGLACCLDHLSVEGPLLAKKMLCLLSTVQTRKASVENALLHYLLDSQRYNLVGGLLFQQHHRTNKTLIDWSNRLLCQHLNADARDPDIFSTLLTDWLSWSSLEALTKLNLSNNAISRIPMCLLTQLPHLQDLDLSHNDIVALPDFASLASVFTANTTLAPSLTRLDLSNNALITLPPWIFGVVVGANEGGGTPLMRDRLASAKSGVVKPNGGALGGVTFAPRLSILRVCSNQLRSVPRQMWLARQLQCLDLSANSLTELPRASIEEVLSAAVLRSESPPDPDVNRARDLSCLPHLPNSIQFITMLNCTKDAGIPSSASAVIIDDPGTVGHQNRGLLHLWLQGNRLPRLPLAEPTSTRQTSDEKGLQDGVGLVHLAPALTSLDVSGNRLTGPFPPPALFPPNLVHLDLSNNRISTVAGGRNAGDGGEAGGGFQTSNVGAQKASVILDGQLKHLFHLNLRGNCISVFNPVSSHGNESGGEALLWFPELASLDLSGNTNLISLGSAVCRLEKLSSLELDGCTSLTELPPDLWRLSKLKSLTLFNTPAYERLVREIRAGDDTAVRKSSRHAIINQRRRVGKSLLLSTLTDGVTAGTANNTTSPAMPILNTKTVLDYLKSLPRSSRPYNKVRLMLIGSRGVGKTSLLKALLRSEGQDVQDAENSASTSSVTLTPLSITRHCPTERARNEWTETVNFTVWDFKSPESAHSSSPIAAMVEEVESVMSAVQQFSMSRSTIYVVVWNAMDAPDALHGVARHLVAIQTRASNAPVLVVATHADATTSSEVSDLAERCFIRCTDPASMGLSQQIVGHFLVDSRYSTSDNYNREALYHLVTAIHHSANYLRPPFRKPIIGAKFEPGRQRLLSFPVPLVYHELEEVTRDLASDLHRVGIPPIVSLDDYVTEVNSRLQASSGFDSSEEVRFALTFLHEIGHLLYFSNLSRAVVLDPIWLCDLLVRLLITPSTAPTRAGVLKLSRLKDLLVVPMVSTEASSVDADRIMHRFQHLEISFALTYLVELLAKFELAAPLDSHHLLVPALLPLRNSANIVASNRQIRITPLNLVMDNEKEGEVELEGLLRDSDPLNCSVFTLPRGKKWAASVSPLQPVLASDLQDQLAQSSEPVTSSRRHNIFSKFAAWQNNLVPRGLCLSKPKTVTNSTTAATSFFQRNDRTRRPTPRGGWPTTLLQPQTPLWRLRAAPRANEVLRVYALAYVPAGFWTRLITRLLTDTDLNNVCGHLYNLASIPPKLRSSLLCLEIPPNADEGGSSIGSLQCGWSLSRRGIQLTLAGGAVPVFTLEQVGNRVSLVTASLEETEIAVEANEKIGLKDACLNEDEGGNMTGDEKSALGGLDEIDYKGWNLRLLRFSTGSSEQYREHLRGIEVSAVDVKVDKLIVEPFDDFSKYCLIQLHMPSFSIFWPEYRGTTKEKNSAKSWTLEPDRRTLTQILTKIVHHIDCLLLDWYPDLGTRFNQSSSGEYLVHRVIPCTDCVRPPQIENAEIREVVSTLDSVLNAETGNRNDTSDESLECREKKQRVVYGVLVEEMVHWLLTPARKQPNVGALGRNESLPCPVHSDPSKSPTHYGISAPDLLLMDVREDMRVSSSRVMLERFLGRGTFGSVFAGSAFLSGSSSPASVTSATDSMLNLVKVPVGVKICSPINPEQVDIRLSDWQPYTEEKEEQGAGTTEEGGGEAGTEAKPTSSNTHQHSHPNRMDLADLRVALALYKQERRRWSLQPVESCYTAYQELRSELAVLMRVCEDSTSAPGITIGGGFSAAHELPFRSQSSFRSLRRGVVRRSARSHARPRLFSAANSITSAMVGHHLLSCIGVVSPRPLSLLLPLAPQGSLSDWMEEMKKIYEADGIYPVHQNTLTMVVHQVATALAYLHRVRIVYRDLKPDNLLVWHMPPPLTTSTTNTTGTRRERWGCTLTTSTPASNFEGSRGGGPGTVQVVLGDFGVSRWRASLDGCRGYVGTPGFMAPEVLATLGEETYSHKVDIYALGILMASIAKFQLPYRGFTNLRFQLNQHILSGGRPDIPAKIKSHCPAAYLDLMSLCWSHEPQLRPEASSIVKVTQRPLPPPTPPPLSEVSGLQCLRQARLPMAVETGFEAIHNVQRVDAVEVVTCAIIDLQGRVWIGGYSVQSEPDPERSGDAFFESTAPNRIGRLVAVVETLNSTSCGLACSWTSRRDGNQGQRHHHVPSPSSLPLNLYDGGHPVALSVDADGHLWCADSVGRLMAFSISSLSLLACTSLTKASLSPMEGDCIWMLSVDYRSVVLGLSTGWICSACLNDVGSADSAATAVGIVITWSFNSLRQSRRVKQLSSSNLYLCGVRVSKGLLWLGGTSSTITELQHVDELDTWQQTATWKATIAAPTGAASLAVAMKTSQKSHNCGRLCDQSPAVTCITSNWDGKEGSALDRAWTYMYPDGEIVCWSVHTRTPLQSVKLDCGGENLHLYDSASSTSSSDIALLIGSVEQLLWAPENGLLAGTSRGTLLRIHWPLLNNVITGDDSDIDGAFDGASVAASSPITAQALRLHRGPAEACFSLLSASLSLGRGFVHPLRQCLAECCQDGSVSTVVNSNTYFLVSLFTDDGVGDVGE
uniref:non-specific serine/threonine protein kinase n=1 Tax=Echinococcus granulosus TaxID=6210 RepID=A0A068WN64_ECHGR|nr:leucine rich repeat serine:threonine protein [Echinococcus granulosus]